MASDIAELVAKAAAGPAGVHVVAGGDHFYTGLQDQVGELVARWLADRIS